MLDFVKHLYPNANGKFKVNAPIASAEQVEKARYWNEIVDLVKEIGSQRKVIDMGHTRDAVTRAWEKSQKGTRVIMPLDFTSVKRINPELKKLVIADLHQLDLTSKDIYLKYEPQGMTELAVQSIVRSQYKGRHATKVRAKRMLQSHSKEDVIARFKLTGKEWLDIEGAL